MKDTNDYLIIGDSSQLSYFLPKESDRISSRNLDYSSIKDYKRIFVCFAEQRTFKDDADFVDINYNYTLEVIDNILPKSDDIVFYSTAMLWEGTEEYDIDDPYSYDESNKYLVSKDMISRELKNVEKVKIHYPCNFNSTHRKSGYLFSKLIDACKGIPISTGNLSFSRELAHTSYIADKSAKSNKSQIIAPGFLTSVEKYFTDVISAFGYSIDDVVTQNLNQMSIKKNSKNKTVDSSYSYDIMLSDTINDIRNLTT